MTISFQHRCKASVLVATAQQFRIYLSMLFSCVLFMSSVVAVSKRLAVHLVLALPQCVAGWMAPSKNVRRGRPLCHSPVATRSRAAASRAAVARSAMGPPPADCHVVQHFDDEPALQQVVRLVAGAGAGWRGTRSAGLKLLTRCCRKSTQWCVVCNNCLRPTPYLRRLQ